MSDFQIVLLVVAIVAAVVAVIAGTRRPRVTLAPVAAPANQGARTPSRWRKRARRWITAVVFFFFAVPLSFIFAPWYMGALVVLWAVWTMLSTVTTHAVEFANRISGGERVPIQDHDNGELLKEGTVVGGKRPWELVNYFPHDVRNYQGKVTLVTATGKTRGKKPKGRGEINIGFTYQARINAEVGDAQGRLRAQEMHASVIETGVSDAIEGELVSEVSRVSLEDALGSKEELEQMARAVVELETMPDKDEKFFDYLGIPFEPPAAGKRLAFYRKHLEEAKPWFKDPQNRRKTSLKENMYGLDIILFIITKVLPSDQVTAALEYPRMAEALGAGVQVFLDQGHDPKSAERLALLAAKLTTGFDISGSGSGNAISLLPLAAAAQGGGHGGHSDKSHKKDHH